MSAPLAFGRGNEVLARSGLKPKPTVALAPSAAPSSPLEAVLAAPSSFGRNASHAEEADGFLPSSRVLQPLHPLKFRPIDTLIEQAAAAPLSPQQQNNSSINPAPQPMPVNSPKFGGMASPNVNSTSFMPPLPVLPALPPLSLLQKLPAIPKAGIFPPPAPDRDPLSGRKFLTMVPDLTAIPLQAPKSVNGKFELSFDGIGQPLPSLPSANVGTKAFDFGGASGMMPTMQIRLPVFNIKTGILMCFAAVTLSLLFMYIATSYYYHITVPTPGDLLLNNRLSVKADGRMGFGVQDPSWNMHFAGAGVFGGSVVSQGELWVGKRMTVDGGVHLVSSSANSSSASTAGLSHAAVPSSSASSSAGAGSPSSISSFDRTLSSGTGSAFPSTTSTSSLDVAPTGVTINSTGTVSLEGSTSVQGSMNITGNTLISDGPSSSLSLSAAFGVSAISDQSIQATAPVFSLNVANGNGQLVLDASAGARLSVAPGLNISMTSQRGASLSMGSHGLIVAAPTQAGVIDIKAPDGLASLQSTSGIQLEASNGSISMQAAASFAVFSQSISFHGSKSSFSLDNSGAVLKTIDNAAMTISAQNSNLAINTATFSVNADSATLRSNSLMSLSSSSDLTMQAASLLLSDSGFASSLSLSNADAVLTAPAITANANNGSLSLSSAQGPVLLESTAGAVDISSKLDLALTSASGKLALNAADAVSITAKTGTLSLSSTSGTASLSSSSGNVLVNSSAMLTASSQSDMSFASSNGNVVVEAKRGSISLTANTDASISASSVQVEAATSASLTAGTSVSVVAGSQMDINSNGPMSLQSQATLALQSQALLSMSSNSGVLLSDTGSSANANAFVSLDSVSSGLTLGSRTGKPVSLSSTGPMFLSSGSMALSSTTGPISLQSSSSMSFSSIGNMSLASSSDASITAPSITLREPTGASITIDANGLALATAASQAFALGGAGPLSLTGSTLSMVAQSGPLALSAPSSSISLTAPLFAEINAPSISLRDASNLYAFNLSSSSGIALQTTSGSNLPISFSSANALSMNASAVQVNSLYGDVSLTSATVFTVAALSGDLRMSAGNQVRLSAPTVQLTDATATSSVALSSSGIALATTGGPLQSISLSSATLQLSAGTGGAVFQSASSLSMTGSAAVNLTSSSQITSTAPILRLTTASGASYMDLSSSGLRFISSQSISMQSTQVLTMEGASVSMTTTTGDMSFSALGAASSLQLSSALALSMTSATSISATSPSFVLQDSTSPSTSARLSLSSSNGLSLVTAGSSPLSINSTGSGLLSLSGGSVKLNSLSNDIIIGATSAAGAASFSATSQLNMTAGTDMFFTSRDLRFDTTSSLVLQSKGSGGLTLHADAGPLVASSTGAFSVSSDNSVSMTAPSLSLSDSLAHASVSLQASGLSLTTSNGANILLDAGSGSLSSIASTISLVSTSERVSLSAPSSNISLSAGVGIDMKAPSILISDPTSSLYSVQLSATDGLALSTSAASIGIKLMALNGGSISASGASIGMSTTLDSTFNAGRSLLFNAATSVGVISPSIILQDVPSSPSVQFSLNSVSGISLSSSFLPLSISSGNGPLSVQSSATLSLASAIGPTTITSTVSNIQLSSPSGTISATAPSIVLQDTTATTTSVRLTVMAASGITASTSGILPMSFVASGSMSVVGKALTLQALTGDLTATSTANLNFTSNYNLLLNAAQWMTISSATGAYIKSSQILLESTGISGMTLSSTSGPMAFKSRDTLALTSLSSSVSVTGTSVSLKDSLSRAVITLDPLIGVSLSTPTGLPIVVDATTGTLQAFANTIQLQAATSLNFLATVGSLSLTSVLDTSLVASSILLADSSSASSMTVNSTTIAIRTTGSNGIFLSASSGPAIVSGSAIAISTSTQDILMTSVRDISISAPAGRIAVTSASTISLSSAQSTSITSTTGPVAIASPAASMTVSGNTVSVTGSSSVSMDSPSGTLSLSSSSMLSIMSTFSSVNLAANTGSILAVANSISLTSPTSFLRDAGNTVSVALSTTSGIAVASISQPITISSATADVTLSASMLTIRSADFSSSVVLSGNTGSSVVAISSFTTLSLSAPNIIANGQPLTLSRTLTLSRLIDLFLATPTAQANMAKAVSWAHSCLVSASSGLPSTRCSALYNAVTRDLQGYQSGYITSGICASTSTPTSYCTCSLSAVSVGPINFGAMDQTLSVPTYAATNPCTPSVPAPVVSVCEAGTYLESSIALCNVCPPGFTCNNGVMTLVPAGSYALSGSFSGTLCPMGTFAGIPGASACSVCPPNTYASSRGQSSCTSCPVGTSSSSYGATSASSCV